MGSWPARWCGRGSRLRRHEHGAVDERTATVDPTPITIGIPTHYLALGRRRSATACNLHVVLARGRSAAIFARTDVDWMERCREVRQDACMMRMQEEPGWPAE